MAAQTEAEGLIESGALYTRRIGFATPTDPVFVGIKHGASSVYFGDGPFFHFDLEGRWQRILLDGIHYLKGLDGVVRSIDRVRVGENLILERRVQSYAEVADLDEVVRQMAIDLMEKISDGSYPRIEPPTKPGIRPLSSSETRDLLEKVATWDASAWFNHRERYLSTYSALPFVPPECMNPLVVQATTGDPRAFGFGGVESQPLVVRSPAEFAKHLSAVSRLMGARVSQMRQIFLAGADALLQTPRSVIGYLDAINSVFPIPETLHKGKAAEGSLDEHALQIDGISSFLLDFDRVSLSQNDWVELRSRKLKAVTVGIESGDRDVRASFGRTWDEDGLGKLISDMQMAGLKVNLAVLADLGGAAARAETARLVGSLPLTKGAIVSLIRAGDLTGESNVTPEDPRDTMKSALGSLKAAGVKVVPFLPEKQWI